jgi:ABC-type Na+ efflux pump permease subunit
LKKLTALTFATLIAVSALMVAFSQPANGLSEYSIPIAHSSAFSASNSSGNETIIPGSENGLIVALGGIVAVVLFLMVLLLRVLKKRKNKMH